MSVVRYVALSGSGAWRAAANAGSATLTADVVRLASFAVVAWASAHRGKWGQLTPWKNG